VKWRFCRRFLFIEKVTCIQLVVPQKFPRRCVQIVRSGLHTHDHLRATSPVLRRIGTGKDLEFLDGVDIGRSVKLLIAGSLLSMPSSRLLFALSRAPTALKPPRKLRADPGAGEREPGASCAREANSRPFNGSSTTFWLSMTVPTDDASDCTSGTVAVTMSFSATSPICKVKSIRR